MSFLLPYKWINVNGCTSLKKKESMLKILPNSLMFTSYAVNSLIGIMIFWHLTSSLQLLNLWICLDISQSKSYKMRKRFKTSFKKLSTFWNRRTQFCQCIPIPIFMAAFPNWLNSTDIIWKVTLAWCATTLRSPTLRSSCQLSRWTLNIQPRLK